jgi:hypothetical protein
LPRHCATWVLCLPARRVYRRWRCKAHEVGCVIFLEAALLGRLLSCENQSLSPYCVACPAPSQAHTALQRNTLPQAVFPSNSSPVPPPRTTKGRKNLCQKLWNQHHRRPTRCRSTVCGADKACIKLCRYPTETARLVRKTWFSQQDAITICKLCRYSIYATNTFPNQHQRSCRREKLQALCGVSTRFSVQQKL